ncbi:MAG: hypothetical protein U1F46_03885 [Marinagarivorans sp.]
MYHVAWLPNADIKVLSTQIQSDSLEISYCADNLDSNQALIEFQFYNGKNTATATIDTAKDESVLLKFDGTATYKSVSFSFPFYPYSITLNVEFVSPSGETISTTTDASQTLITDPEKNTYSLNFWAPSWAEVSRVGVSAFSPNHALYSHYQSVKSHDWSINPSITGPNLEFNFRFISETKQYSWGPLEDTAKHGNISMIFSSYPEEKLDSVNSQYSENTLQWHISHSAGLQAMPDLPAGLTFKPNLGGYYVATSDLTPDEYGVINLNLPHEYESFSAGSIDIIPLQKELHRTTPTELIPFQLPPEHLGFQFAHPNGGKWSPTTNIHTWLYNSQGDIIKEGYSDANGVIDFGVVADADSVGYSTGSTFPTITVNIIYLPIKTGLVQFRAYPLDHHLCNRIKLNDYELTLPFKPIDFEYSLESYKLYHDLNAPAFNLGVSICENELNSYKEAFGALGIKNNFGDWAFLDIFARDGSFYFPDGINFKPGRKLPAAINPGGDLIDFTASISPVVEQTFGLHTLNDTDGYYPDSTQVPLIEIAQTFSKDRAYCSRTVDAMTTNPDLELAKPITLPLEQDVTFERSSLSFNSRTTPGADQYWKTKTSYVFSNEIFVGVTTPFESTKTSSIVKIPALPNQYQDTFERNLQQIQVGVSAGGAPNNLNYMEFLGTSSGLKIGAGTITQREKAPVKSVCSVRAEIH